jgi:hypothetical protein
MKNTTIGIIVLVVVIAAAGLFYFYGMTPVNYPTNQPSQGTAFFSISDKSADLGSVTSIKITVDEVQIHSNTQGWVTVSNATETYDLIQLKNSGNSALLANVQLQPDLYDQLRLNVSSVTVTDANGTADAKLPSGEIRFDSDINITSNSTTSLNFDFLANESLHVTGNGKYILAPVVHFTSTRDANVQTDLNGNVHASGGDVEADTKIGMDVNGSVDVGLKIPDDQNLSIDSNGKIKIGLGLGH